MSDISDRLHQHRRPHRPDWRLLILFLLLNAALFAAVGIFYLLYSWLDSLPQR